MITCTNGPDIFCRPGPALNFKYTHPGIHHFIQKTNRTQIFGRHDVFILYVQFYFILPVFYGICPTANLVTGTSVSRSIPFVQTQITFSGNCHAKCPMGKHLNLNQFPLWTPQIVFNNLTMNLRHLLQNHLPGQYNHISIPSKKTDSFVISYITLRTDMNFNPDRMCIKNS